MIFLTRTHLCLSVSSAGMESKGGMRSGNREGFSPTHEAHGSRAWDLHPGAAALLPSRRGQEATGDAALTPGQGAGQHRDQRPPGPAHDLPQTPEGQLLAASPAFLPHLSPGQGAPTSKLNLDLDGGSVLKSPPGVCVSKCGSCSQAVVGP